MYPKEFHKNLKLIITRLSPAIGPITFRYLMSLAIHEKLDMPLMDLVTVYLYGATLDNDIYIKILEGFRMIIYVVDSFFILLAESKVFHPNQLEGERDVYLVWNWKVKPKNAKLISAISWHLPSIEFHKLNTDASVKNSKAYCGGVAGNEDGI